MTIRAAAYLRSSKDEEAQGLGIECQRDAVKDLCQQRGWTLDERWLIPENHPSAWDDSKPRPGFERLLRGMESGEVKAVAVFAFDRLARRLEDVARVLKVVEKHGVLIAAHTANLDLSTLPGLAALLRIRNPIDAEIAAVIHRPMTAGHLGEWIAARVFGIVLEANANHKASDGHFRGGPLDGCSVDVKWYLRRDGILDMSASKALDFYLVLAGPKVSAATSLGTTRPWHISSVHLIEAQALAKDLRSHGLAVGVASSVRERVWACSQVYPHAKHPLLPLTAEQSAALALFAPPA